jgi:hypothetical protein
MKKNHYVIREIEINAPQQEVFEFLKLLKNQDKFNKWAKAGANRDWNYKGIDGTVGFVISWNGDKKVGEGEKEIMHIIEDKKIETQIRFIRPMITTANINFELEPLTDNRTKVFMSNAGKLNYPMNVFIPIAEKNFPKDMDVSLMNLKTILEK